MILRASVYACCRRSGIISDVQCGCHRLFKRAPSLVRSMSWGLTSNPVVLLFSEIRPIGSSLQYNTVLDVREDGSGRVRHVVQDGDSIITMARYTLPMVCKALLCCTSALSIERGDIPTEVTYRIGFERTSVDARETINWSRPASRCAYDCLSTISWLID